ncbi:MAG: hypothetical protein H0X69_00395 [Gemmatimonadales bacterium]|nr:hypothetical protein [Gemmatimonadales bacterium]
MTGGEHQAQQVVADVIVDRGVEIRHGRLLAGLELVPELLPRAHRDGGPQAFHRHRQRTWRQPGPYPAAAPDVQVDDSPRQPGAPTWPSPGVTSRSR